MKQIVEPTVNELVDKIVAFNNCWHSLRDNVKRETERSSVDQQTMLKLLGTSIANLRDIKARLQVQLLRHSSGIAELRYDPRVKIEPCYTVALKTKVSKRDDACHMPARIARRLLDKDEFDRFCVEDMPSATVKEGESDEHR